MRNFGATERQHNSQRWTREQSTKNDSRVGYWTHDQIVEMDRNATLQMVRFHPDHASQEIKALLDEIKKRKITPQFTLTPIDTKHWFDELLASLPEQQTRSDMTRIQAERLDIETALVIRKAVAARYGMTLNDLDSNCRHHRLVLARQEAMYFVARDCPSLSYPRMGRMFGGRDHTSIFYSIRKHADRAGLPRVREGVAV